MDAAARALVLAGILPLWIAAGFADWLCHRSTHIEEHGGLPENLFHWLLFSEFALAVLAVLACEPNGAVIAIVLVAFAVHEVTVWRELRYAAPRREIRPVEQMVHSFIEVLPIALAAVLALEALAGGTLGDFGLHLRGDHKDWTGPLLLVGAALIFNVAPLAEETVRCLRGNARSASRTPSA